MEALWGASNLLHCTTGKETQLHITRVHKSHATRRFIQCLLDNLKHKPQTCTCGCGAVPLSRGQAAHCGFSHQGVAFLAGKVTTRTKGEGLQGVHTCHVARKWKQNGGALFYCNRTIDDNHKHEKSTWNCALWRHRHKYVENMHADIITCPDTQ